MLYTVYQITNLINDKIYIGVHAVENLEIDDGYMGSGLAIKGATRKYGLQNFKKKILAAFANKVSAYLMEAEIVDLEFVLREDTYNITCGGRGAQSGENHSLYGKMPSEETRRKMSEAKQGEKNYWFGKEHSEETKTKMSVTQRGEKNHRYGKSASEEAKQKLSDAQKGEKNPFYGRHHSEETKAKQSEARKEYWRKRKEIVS